MTSSLKYFGNATSNESQSEAAAMLLRVLCILLLGVLGAEASFFNKTQAAIEEVRPPAALPPELGQIDSCFRSTLMHSCP